MVGCAGTVLWEDRDTLCAGGASACGAEQWVDLRGGVAPTHNYWTHDALLYYGNPSSCFASTTTGNECSPESSPMRVCAGGSDPEGNECNWYDCGYESWETNEYFGGCNGNYTAGTACCI